MNTIRSTWYGWATLCVAGGGAYYFAKQQINADRASRYNEERKKQERLHRLEAQMPFADVSSTRHKKKKSAEHEDVEHTEAAGGADGDAILVPGAQKSKYEAEKPYRSKKGDRFS